MLCCGVLTSILSLSHLLQYSTFTIWGNWRSLLISFTVDRRKDCVVFLASECHSVRQPERESQQWRASSQDLLQQLGMRDSFPSTSPWLSFSMSLSGPLVCEFPPPHLSFFIKWSHLCWEISSDATLGKSGAWDIQRKHIDYANRIIIIIMKVKVRQWIIENEVVHFPLSYFDFHYHDIACSN